MKYVYYMAVIITKKERLQERGVVYDAKTDGRIVEW